MDWIWSNFARARDRVHHDLRVTERRLDFVGPTQKLGLGAASSIA